MYVQLPFTHLLDTRIDGVTSWDVLPFEAVTVGAAGSGSQVDAAAANDMRLVLVEQTNNQAAFWSLPLR